MLCPCPGPLASWELRDWLLWTHGLFPTIALITVLFHTLQDILKDDLMPTRCPRFEDGEAFFSTKNGTVITATAGSVAILPCSVRNLCDGTVSWIRRSDFNLLTVGSNTYVGDDRLSQLHAFNSNDWALQIKFVNVRDAGFYECQVTSHPPFSIFLYLHVIEAKAEIEGPVEKFIKFGSRTQLKCRILNSTITPEYVFWYFNNRMVNYDKDRGMNITTVLAEKKSSLVIARARKEHAGNYTCVGSNANPATVFVHIVHGELPAAMQTSAVLDLRSCHFWITFISLYFILYLIHVML